MGIARNGPWIVVLVVFIGEAELYARHPVSTVLVLGLVAILWVRRWPLQCLVGIPLLLLADAVSGGVLLSDLVTPLLVVACVSFVAGGRTALLHLSLTALLSTVILTTANQVAEPGSFTTANDAVFFAVLVGAPAAAGRLLAERSGQVAELGRLNTELDRRQQVAVRAARAAEAERVERAVDEALAGRLQTIIAGIRRADTLAGVAPDAVPSVMSGVETTSRAGLSELRSVLGVLQSPTAAPVSVPMRPDPTVKQHEAPRTGRSWVAPDRVDLVLVLAVVPLAVETSLQPSPGPGWLNILACAAQGGFLLVVRRAPVVGTLPFLLVACLQTAFLTALPETVSWMLPALSLALLLGLRMSWRHRWWGLVMCGGTALGVQLCTRWAGSDPDGVLPALGIMGLAWWAGLTATARRRRTLELAASADELSRTTDLNVRLGAAEQRAEMARELHDVGAHALTVVCLQAGAAQTMWDRDRGQEPAASYSRTCRASSWSRGSGPSPVARNCSHRQ